MAAWRRQVLRARPRLGNPFSAAPPRHVRLRSEQNERQPAWLVVLFSQNDSKKGQFHIGFADIPDHYSAEENSNIQKNYADYCEWYGEIRPYQHCPPPPPLPALNAAELLAPPPPAALAAEARGPILSATAQERNNLRETVQQFLNAWYVQADYARLDGFIARDNMLSQTAPASESPWRKYFREAFRDDLPVKTASLNDAIAYHEMTLPTGFRGCSTSTAILLASSPIHLPSSIPGQHHSEAIFLPPACLPMSSAG